MQNRAKVKVFTYINPKTWANYKEFETIKDAIHITSTQSLKEGISECYQRNGNFKYIFSIKEVITKLFEEWNTPEYKLKKYLELSKVIEGISNPTSEDLKQAFKKNSSELLDTIEYFVWIGLAPKDLNLLKDELSEKEELFVRVWSELENNDQSYNDLRKMLNGHCDSKDFVDILGFKKEKPIVLHGFYYITPQQQKVLGLLQTLGWDIIFFQHYDLRFTNTFGFMNQFISKYQKLTNKSLNLTSEEIISQCIEPTKQYLNYSNQLSNGQIFLSHFENKEFSLNSTEQKLYKYDTFFEFLHQVIMKYYPPTLEEEQDKTMNAGILNPPTIEKKQNCTIIATNADILNPLLVQYYPSLHSSKRNFLNYPVGQFVLNIHEMYDQGKLILNDKILMSVFSSGWLYDEECNARDLTYQLKQILPFFQGCNEFREWEDRMGLLLKHYDKIENNRWEKNEEVIADLLPKLSYYSLKKAEVEKINEFIKALQDINNQLFISDNSVKKETSLGDYFKDLNQLLNGYNPVNYKNSASFTTEETEIIKAILGKVDKVCKNYENHKDSILYNDLKEALCLFLSGKFDEEENLIKPFIEIDGEIFKEHSKPIFLTGLDENGLPLSRFKTPWPLKDNTFKSLSDKYPIIELDILRNESIKCISRYLLYLALEFLPQNQLQLSWIANFLDKKDLEPSTYMRIQNMKVSDYYSKEEHSSEESQESNSKTGMINFPLPISGFESLIYEFCPKRWYYSYFTDSNATYSTDFNQKRLFSHMVDVMRIKSANYKISVNDSNVINEAITTISEYFPQLTDTEKRMQGFKYIKFRFIDDDPTNTFIQQRKYIFSTSGSHLHINNIDNFLKPQGWACTKIEAKSDDKERCKYCEYLDSCPDGVNEKNTRNSIRK